MSFNWRDYFGLAEELGQPSKDAAFVEARQRSAISRAYYAVYVEARTYLEDKLIISKNVADDDSNLHSLVRKKFRASYDVNMRSIGLALDSLRTLRNSADYDHEFPDLAAATKRALDQARKALKRLEKL